MQKLLQFDVFRFISPNSISPNFKLPMHSVERYFESQLIEIRSLPIIKLVSFTRNNITLLLLSYTFFLSKLENNAIIGLYLKLEQMLAPSSECICKISKIRTYSGSRSSKVIDFGVNRKPMYDFLLVTNSNFSRICYRFRDIDALNGKW